MINSISSGFWRIGRRSSWAGALLVLAFALMLADRGQAQAGAPGMAKQGRILLVLPFDNQSGQPSLEWIREAAAEVVSSRLAAAGFAPMSREDRLYALDHLGLPQGFHPSRATALKLAETLDADSIVVGNFQTEGAAIAVEARLVNVPQLRLSAAVTGRGEMRDLVTVLNSLAWKLARQLDPGFAKSEESFVAEGSGLRVDAFEQYTRGITEPDQAERLRHLQEAVKLSPDLGPAWMALGREYFSGQQFEEAAEAFAKVGGTGPDALEAGFYRGLSLLYSGDYRGAEQAFAGVARIMPLAPVVNNEGVAMSRQGQDAAAMFRQAAAADPNVADYHFNLALALKRRVEPAEANNELAQCLRLRPDDDEAAQLAAEWKAPAGKKAAEDEVRADPLERIARTFDAAAFRQAAQVLDEMEGARLAGMKPGERAEWLAAESKRYLERGLMAEAGRMSLDAVAADGKVAEAHAAVAMVREKSGDTVAARGEARAALELAPSADAYLVLGRLDLAVGRVSDAAYEDGEALKIEPGSRAAAELRRLVEARQAQKK